MLTLVMTADGEQFTFLAEFTLRNRAEGRIRHGPSYGKSIYASHVEKNLLKRLVEGLEIRSVCWLVKWLVSNAADITSCVTIS